MSQRNGTLTAVAASWQNLLVLLQAAGYAGRSAAAQLTLAPEGDIRVKRNSTNATAPVSAADGIGIGASAIGGPTFEWNGPQFIELAHVWIYGDTTDVEYDVTGAEW